jgi:hypothetical protein
LIPWQRSSARRALFVAILKIDFGLSRKKRKPIPDEKENGPLVVQLPNALYGQVKLETGFDKEGIKGLRALAEEMDNPKDVVPDVNNEAVALLKKKFMDCFGLLDEIGEKLSHNGKMYLMDELEEFLKEELNKVRGKS